MSACSRSSFCVSVVTHHAKKCRSCCHKAICLWVKTAAATWKNKRGGLLLDSKQFKRLCLWHFTVSELKIKERTLQMWELQTSLPLINHTSHQDLRPRSYKAVSLSRWSVFNKQVEPETLTWRMEHLSFYLALSKLPLNTLASWRNPAPLRF